VELTLEEVKSSITCSTIVTNRKIIAGTMPRLSGLYKQDLHVLIIKLHWWLIFFSTCLIEVFPKKTLLLEAALELLDETTGNLIAEK
jgi:hypothetical protein